MDELTQKALLQDLETALAPGDLAKLRGKLDRIAELQKALPELAARHSAARAELEAAKVPVRAAETKAAAARAELAQVRNATAKVRALLDQARGEESDAKLELERLQTDLAARLPHLRRR